MSKTLEEIDAEKAAQPRPDLVPGAARMAAGAVMARGLCKHGAATYLIAGTEQAKPETHIASADRHMAKCEGDLGALDSDSGLPHLWHAYAQLGIAIACAEAEKAERPEKAWRNLETHRVPVGAVVVDRDGGHALNTSRGFRRAQPTHPYDYAEIWHGARIAQGLPHSELVPGTVYLYVAAGELQQATRACDPSGSDSPCYPLEGGE